MTKKELCEVMLNVAYGLRIEAQTGEDTPESQQLEKYAQELEDAANKVLKIKKSSVKL